jgi:bis(5'-nucleosyl)-tetraphosphatase (symmetrical)
MALYAIGDIQGCDAELGALLKALKFSADRDRLWFVGDLVNRGPESLETLRRIRALGDAATVTLGNHDLHLLAVSLGVGHLRSDDTLDAILAQAHRKLTNQASSGRLRIHKNPWPAP